MSKQNSEMFMKKIKRIMDSYPPREKQAIDEGRSRFLAQAKMFKGSPVPFSRPDRLNKWIFHNFQEVKMTTLATILVVIGLLFGGITGTVAAANDDLPGQALYQVKLLTEGTRLGLTQDPVKRMELDLQFALRRLAEIKELQEAGIEPPFASYARIENHLEHAIDRTEKMDPTELPGALLRIREVLRTCLEQTETPVDEPLQTRLRTMLQERISWLDDFITDPALNQVQTREGWEMTPAFMEDNQVKVREQNRIRELTQENATEDPGSGPGYQTPGPGYQTPGPGYQTPGPGYKTPGPGYKTPGPGNTSPEPGYQTPGPGYQTPGPGYQTPGPGDPTSTGGNQQPGSGNQTSEPGGSSGGSGKKP